MTVTELISALEHAYVIHGDIPVSVNYADYDCSPTFVDFDNKEFVISVEVKNITNEELNEFNEQFTHHLNNNGVDNLNEFLDRNTVEKDIVGSLS